MNTFSHTTALSSAILPNLTELAPDVSSQIGAIGFDAAIGMLFVQFRRGGLYTYDNVTQAEYDALLASPKVGTLFAKTIKGVKPFQRIDSGKAPAKPKAEAAPAPAAPTGTLVQFRPNALTPAVANTKEVDDLSTAAREWAMKASNVVITDMPTHEQAQRMLLDIDTVRKRIIETWKPMKDAAFKAHRAVCDKESELLKPLVEADRALRSRIGEYTYLQLQAAREKDEEQRRIAEAEARQRAIVETEEGALAAAEELYAMGDHEGAEAVLDAPMPAPIRYEMPVPVKPAVAAVEGVGGSIAYEVSIANIADVPREYLVIDLVKTRTEIARRVKQAGGRLQVPGCVVRETFATRRVGGRR